MRFIVSQGGNEITTASGDLKINTANTLALTIDTSQDATFAGGVSATTGTFSGQVTIPETPTADTHAASKGYVDAAVEGQDTLAEILAIGNTTGGTDIAITAGDKITNFTSTGIDDNSTSTVLTIDSSNRALFSGDVSLGANLIGNTNATGDLTILGSLFIGDYGANDDPDLLYADNNIVRIGYYSNAKQFEVNNSDFKVTATHKVGIGTNDPQTLFEISNENIGTTTAPIIRLNNVDSSLSDGQNLGSIEFYDDHNNSTTANIGVFHSTDGSIVKEMKFNLGSSGDILTLDANEINAAKKITITGTGSTPRLTLENGTIDAGSTYSLRSQDNGDFGIFQESSEILSISNYGDVFINAQDNGGITIVSDTDEAAYLDFSDGSGVKNFLRVDHDGDIFGYNSWGSHEFTLGEGVPSLTLDDNGATFTGNVGIGGAASSTHTLDLNSASNLALRFYDSTTFKAGMQAVDTGGQMISSSADGDFAIRSQSNMLFSTGGNTERMRIDSDGNVNIVGTNSGASNTSMKLIFDNTDVTVQANQLAGGIEWHSDDSSGAGAGIKNSINSFFTGTGGYAEMRFSTSGTDGNNTERMRIDSSGNVGIGETSPSYKLTVADDTASGRAIQVVQSATSGTNYGIQGGAYGVGATKNIGLSITAEGATTNHAAHFIGGAVGIGTTDPNQLLEISKNGSPVMRLNSSKTTNGAAGDSIGRIEWRGSNTAGNGAGIKAAIDTSATSTTQRDFNILFKTSNNVGSGEPETRMQINADGNVGIGTTSPDEKLHVANGDIFLQSEYNATGITDSFLYIQTRQSGNWRNSYIGQTGNNLIFGTGGTGTTHTNATERMRITSGGFLKASNNGSYLSSTSSYHEFNNSTTEWTQVNTNTNSAGLGLLLRLNSSTASRMFLAGYSTNIAAYRFKIYADGDMENANNSYGALSDVKLKENIVDASPKLDDLMQVKIRNYNLIGEERKQLGVVAQELEEVFPALVYETPDTERQDINKTDEEGNIIYQTEEILISEAVKGQDAIEWEDKPTTNNTKVEIQTWLDDNEIEWQNADTKQELLDRIPEYQQEAVMPKDAVYETRETDEPVIENKEVDLGTTTKAVKYSVFVPMLIKGMQEQQQLINDLKSRIETLENN
jgi:hypothetical protein